MVDSSQWTVLEAGLKCGAGQGRRQLDLAEGGRGGRSSSRRARARLRRRRRGHGLRRGGPGDTVERKVAICERAYGLLVDEVGFPPEDIIFDPNVLAVATGIQEHDDYARRSSRRSRGSRSAAPACASRGGISNLSFSFRGNDVVREAMHAVFLYHAIRAGLDMGIVNAGQLAVYEDIEPELLDASRTSSSTAAPTRPSGSSSSPSSFQGEGTQARARPLVARGAGGGAAGARARPRHRRLHRGGHGGGAAGRARPLDVIEGPLMGGMQRRRRPLRLGTMFLPQVVKSRPRDEAGRRLPRAVHGGGARRRGRGRRARSCSRRSRATSTTSARTSSASCSAATTTR